MKQIGNIIALASLAMLGCSSSSDNAPMQMVGEGQNFAIGEEPTTIQYVSKEHYRLGAPGEWISLDPYCNEQGQYSNNERIDHYKIENGTLTWWSDDECLADLYHGQSTTVQGVWTSTGEQVDVPTGSNPATCDNNPPPKNISASIKVTDSVLNKNVEWRNFCWSEFEIDKDEPASNESFKTTGCDSYEWTVDGKTAIITLEGFGFVRGYIDQMIRFEYNGATCHREYYPPPEVTPELCASSFARFQASNPTGEFDFWEFEQLGTETKNRNEYQACITASGFPSPASNPDE